MSMTPIDHSFDAPVSEDVAHDPSRRGLLKGGGAAIAAAFAGPIAALSSRVANAAECGGASSLAASPYGETVPTPDLSTGLPLLQLPPGFSYKSFGWTGDLMADGRVTPGAHDGMGVVRERRVGRSTEYVLVRNHERGTSTNGANVMGSGLPNVPIHDSGVTGTSFQIGGNVNLVFRDGNWVESYTSFGGLNRPCAGGSTLWGSWLSNEEVLSNNTSSTGKRHGYVFEVPADISLGQANPNPIIDMGRMAHEASAIDPETGYWYLTEDQGNANTLYRFLPNNLQGGLNSLHAGGRLQGLKVRGVNNANLRFPTLCQEFACEWVDIADPDLNSASVFNVVTNSNTTMSGPYRQAYANGAAVFGANEGCWVAKGVVWFTDKATSTGTPARSGVIWALDLASMVLKAVMVGRDRTVMNSPDNLTISPRGGVLVCEDGGTSGPTSAPIVAQHLKVLNPDGTTSIFARNNYNFTRAQLDAVGKTAAPSGNQRMSEWAGAVFSADGRILFANLYFGLTVAITGPWQRGSL
jgi:secreted PhoX family phosphatase